MVIGSMFCSYPTLLNFIGRNQSLFNKLLIFVISEDVVAGAQGQEKQEDTLEGEEDEEDMEVGFQMWLASRRSTLILLLLKFI